MAVGDLEQLSQGICPDCGTPIRKVWMDSDKPWCRRCNVFFTREGRYGDIVVRNEDALERYNKQWTEQREPTVDPEEQYKEGEGIGVGDDGISPVLRKNG